MRGSGHSPIPESKSEVRTVARGSVINVVGMVVGAGFAFLLTVVFGRWLGPKNAGAIFELIALYTIASNTLELGADTGLTRWISRARVVGEVRYVRWIVLIALVPVMAIGALAATGLWLAAPAIAHIFLRDMAPSAAVADVRLIAPLVPVGAVYACVLAGPRGYARMWPYLVVDGLGKPALRLTLVTVAFLSGWSLRAALLAWSSPVVLGLVVAAVIFAGIIRKESPALGRRRIKRAEGAGQGPSAGVVGRRRADGQHRSPAPRAAQTRTRLTADFWRFTGPRAFAGTFQIVVLWLDILLVGALVSRYAAGVYSAVSKLALIGTFALEGTRLAIAPQFSGLLARGKQHRVANLFQAASRWLILASWPFYVTLAIFPAVVLDMFGHRFAVGASALAVLSVAMMINLGTGNVSVVLLMGGKSSWNAFNSFLALAVNIALNLVLLPRIGIVGASIAWGASITVDNIAALIEVRLFLGLAPFGRGYLVAAAASVSCFAEAGLWARLLLGQTLVGLLAAIGAGMFAYGVVVYLARDRLRLRGVLAAARLRVARTTERRSTARAA